METRGRPIGVYSGGKGSFESQIGERVAFFRRRRGWSKTDFAKRWRKDAPAVTLLEQGKGVVARLDTLAEIAEALNDPEHGKPMSLLEFLWPVLAPKEAVAIEKVVREEVEAEVRELHAELVRKHLSALTSAEAEQILMAIAEFVSVGKPEMVKFVAAMIGRGATIAAAEKELEATTQLRAAHDDLKAILARLETAGAQPSSAITSNMQTALALTEQALAAVERTGRR